TSCSCRSASGTYRSPTAPAASLASCPTPGWWFCGASPRNDLAVVPTEARSAQRRDLFENCRKRGPSTSLRSARGDGVAVMTAYIIRRLFAVVPVMAVVALFVFFLLRFAPGDPAAIIAGEDATTEAIEAVRAKLGLDRPM